MGFWSRLFGREEKSGGMSSLELFREIYGGGRDSMAGVTVSCVSTFEGNRLHQIVQYSSPCSHETTPASANVDTSGPTRTAAQTNAP